MTQADTIAAISTAPGEGAIGIVRLSGPRAFDIAGSLFVSPGGGGLRSHRLHYGHIVEPGTGAQVDEVLLSAMRAPHTYTREDVVEINCHGGLVPLRRVLELALSEGARLAEPGEFTKRAFLNGRIDLSQAEAALDLIRAKTEVSERIALRQLGGGLSERIGGIRDSLAGALAHIEACIDFPEEDIEPDSLEEIRSAIGEAAGRTGALSGSYDEGRLFREGLGAVIAGCPNVGKSSLLNALLQEDRAIVTEMPGTTRDVLEECISIKGLPLRIMDTAGIRQAHDMAEEEGVRRSMRAIEDADLVLGVLDASRPLHEGDGELLRKLRDKNAFLVLNKSDLPRRIGDVSLDGVPALEVSAKTGQGLSELRDAIYGACIKSPAALAEGVVVTNLRHKTSLDASRAAQEAALRAIGEGRPLEIVAMELREALDRLGEVVGAVTADDILERIFSEFCIGK